MLHINPLRLQADFDALAQIGATGDGGVHRPALSEAHLAARQWFRKRAAADGFEVRQDTAGNHSAILRLQGASKTLLLGSHLDSVPNGGRFDGALGVLAALEVLRTVKDTGLKLPVHLEAIDFTDEEGTLVGLLGSEAITGRLTPHALQSPRGGRAALEEGLARAGLTEEGLLSASRDPSSLAGYLELHIEQGPRLAAAGLQIGVVKGIVGGRSFRLTFKGQANHAGTTPMDARRDAGQGASAFLLAAREIVMQDFPGCVANVGQMSFEPGAFNVIPARAHLSLEFRSMDPDQLKTMKSALLARANAEAERFGLDLDIQPLGGFTATPMHPQTQEDITRAADTLGLRHISLASGAGHDAQSLARITPAGMIFVPSVAGISHDPHEFTEWEDCINGANMLLLAAIEMAKENRRV